MNELTEILDRALEAQGEKAVYESYCKRDKWSVYEFVALVARLTPKNYLARKNLYPEISDQIYKKRVDEADLLLKRLIDDLQSPQFLKNFHTERETLCMSSWKYLSKREVKPIFFHLIRRGRLILIKNQGVLYALPRPSDTPTKSAS